jgi:two-component sensor histidine kinase
VIGMLHLQAGAADDEQLAARLTEASTRISAVGHAYERLAYDIDVEHIDLGAYLHEVCEDGIRMSPACKLNFQTASGVKLHADRAIPLALIVNELVTNAAKYAFPDGSNGQIWVDLAQSDSSTAVVSVRDDGVGLPEGFDVSKSKGLGMRIVSALAKQLDAHMTQRSGKQGSEFSISIPL